jgi:glutathione transport system ATP-binding protein
MSPPKTLVSVQRPQNCLQDRRSELQEVVHGLSFDLLEGETLALVGESGSGKTVSAKSILRLTAFRIRLSTPLVHNPILGE